MGGRACCTHYHPLPEGERTSLAPGQTTNGSCSTIGCSSGSLRWLTGSITINTAALMLAPRGYRLGTDRNYDSPNDLISDRYNNRVLSIMCCVTSAAAAIIYVISQFFAMGDLVEGASGGTMDAEATIWVIAAVMLLSEWCYPRPPHVMRRP